MWALAVVARACLSFLTGRCLRSPSVCARREFSSARRRIRAGAPRIQPLYPKPEASVLARSSMFQREVFRNWSVATCAIATMLVGSGCPTGLVGDQCRGDANCQVAGSAPVATPGSGSAGGQAPSDVVGLSEELRTRRTRRPATPPTVPPVVSTCTETDAAFCTRLTKSCGTVSGLDACGQQRSAPCGGCATSQTCGGDNLCQATVPAANSCNSAAAPPATASKAASLASCYQ